MKRNKGFTLVELLAVIVILAIILVIAVPKVMSVIEDAKKATLESTAKMIASQAEKAKVQNTVLGKTDAITCESIAKINDLDYDTCEVVFEDNTAKVTIKGKGKFAGLHVCNGTKTEAEAGKESCTPVINAVNFKDDDWGTIVAAVQSGNYPYQVGDTKTITLGNDLGEHTLRVANTTPCSEVSVESKTACGFVLEFADIVIQMSIDTEVGSYNSEYGSTNGGWPATPVRRYVNDTLYNAIPDDLRNGIIDTYVVSSHNNYEEGTREDGNFESNDKLYLLSPEEVYGAMFDKESLDSSIGTSRQLDFYVNMSNSERSIKLKGVTASDWWLRSARTSEDYYHGFHEVNTYGNYKVSFPTWNYGVAPAFRLSN